MAKQCWRPFTRDNRYAGKFYESVLAIHDDEMELYEKEGVKFSPPNKKDWITDTQMLEEQFTETKQGWEKIREDINIFSVPAKAETYGRTMDSLENTFKFKLEDAQGNDGQDRSHYFALCSLAREAFNEYKDNLRLIEQEVEGVLREANTIRVANLMNKTKGE